MPEFAEFQLNAQQLSMKIIRSYNASTGCFSFFTCIVPQLINNRAIEDAATIGLMADSLNDDKKNDESLKNYILQTKNHSLDDEELKNFKCKILTGMYLMIWCQYNSTVSSYLYTKLIELFQMDLDIESPSTMNKPQFQSSLEALSQYCSYIFQNRNEGIYTRLNQRLGESIQANIHAIRESEGTVDNSWSDVFNGIMSTFGMNNVL